VKKLLIAVVLTVAAVGCTAQATEQPSSTPVEYETEDTGITAEMLVDFSGPALVADFCDNYDVLGYELALMAFSEGYTETDPSAQEVVDELISRC
jgi:hypothetical protein